jgi:hypothetical protein
VTTDNGTEFQTEFKTLLNKIGASHIKTAVGHPESNGAVERVNQTFKRKIRAHCNDDTRDWETFLPQIRQSYMNSRHSSTGFTPNEMLFGHAVKFPLAVRDAVAMEINIKSAEHMEDLRMRKEYIDRKAMLAIRMRQYRSSRGRMRKFPKKYLQLGDMVFEIVKPKSPLHTCVKGPFKIVALSFDKTHATLETGSTADRKRQRFRRHTSHLVKVRTPGI